MKTAYFASPGMFANPILRQPDFSHASHHHDCGCHKRPHYHECCPDCGRPADACCCGSRRCRKEAKELLVEGAVIGRKLVGVDLATARQVLSTVRLAHGSIETSDQTATDTAKESGTQNVARLFEAVTVTESAAATAGIANAFIGGGCCVHLSVEYMPDKPLAPATGAVAVLVADSDKTVMMWAKIVDADDGYRIQEDIITTHPGAKLTVVVFNVTARVRWCEVFSC